MTIAEELKNTLAEVRAKMKELETRHATVGEKEAALDAAVKEIQAKLAQQENTLEDRMQLVFRKGNFEIQREPDSPYYNAVMGGRAKGYKVPDLYHSKAGDANIKAWQENGDLLFFAASAKAFREGSSVKQAWMEIKKSGSMFLRNWEQETGALAKALDTAAAGEGAEFVPTEFSRELIDRVTLGLRVAALHRKLMIPRSPFEMPAVATALPMGFLVPESTSANFLTEANKISEVVTGTRNVTWAARGIGGLAVYSGEIDDDSIVPMGEFARSQLVDSLANAIEEAMMNGAEAATHPDYDTHTASGTALLPARAWDGYRALAIAPSTDTTLDFGGNFTSTLIRTLRAKMVRYGAQPSQLAYVTSIKTILSKWMLLPEIQTLDKLGSNAVVLSGQIASFDGSPVIASDFARDTVDATGFNTNGGTNTKSTLNIINRTAGWFGEVRGMKVETARSIWTDQNIMVAKQRLDFEPIYPKTTEPAWAMGINI
ncbi:MAG: phage major capsid protein [Nitrospirales bacterium]|nr:phage major capsid protein [Nitrospirales bacterium]